MVEGLESNMTKEDLFWHRAENLVTLMDQAVSLEWKKLWKNKIVELMKNPENRVYQLNELKKLGMNLIPTNRTLH